MQKIQLGKHGQQMHMFISYKQIKKRNLAIPIAFLEFVKHYSKWKITDPAKSSKSI